MAKTNELYGNLVYFTSPATPRAHTSATTACRWFWTWFRLRNTWCSHVNLIHPSCSTYHTSALTNITYTSAFTSWAYHSTPHFPRSLRAPFFIILICSLGLLGSLRCTLPPQVLIASSCIFGLLGLGISPPPF